VANPTDEKYVKGARVTNQFRLAARSNLAAAIRGVPAVPRPPIRAEAVALAQAHPTKGWAKRYMRARGLPL
jgi:hypothetical protein